jgi:hypothetical protein
MKRIIPMALIALTLSGGVALADRDRGRGRDTSHYQGGTVVTPSNRSDRRYDSNRRYDNRRYDNRRYDYRRNQVTVERTRPVYRNNRFYFSGGFNRAYTRPVINVRYRDYYRRPALVVENYEPVTGYLWVQGNWNWDGYEWQWIPGHYEVDSADQDTYYDDGYYNDGYYNNGNYNNGNYNNGNYNNGNYNNGVTIQGGVSGSWNY